ncbi:hypothetical protein PAXINDRAFT_157937 [Paxillus involutus ATCC 200175]|uniref:Uncharacterized protein n=1 Tax=Paxillus involutus ATCC 200175 TaxID=664439 RepID=A0A0C9T0P2_PAXIN|nr:hypothetical protein PAXINDRAFT_157937 [Paxillus involutus ATCC 200175]
MKVPPQSKLATAAVIQYSEASPLEAASEASMDSYQISDHQILPSHSPGILDKYLGHNDSTLSLASHTLWRPTQLKIATGGEGKEWSSMKSPVPLTAGPDLGRHNPSRLDIVGYNQSSEARSNAPWSFMPVQNTHPCRPYDDTKPKATQTHDINNAVMLAVAAGSLQASLALSHCNNTSLAQSLVLLFDTKGKRKAKQLDQEDGDRGGVEIPPPLRWSNHHGAGSGGHAAQLSSIGRALESPKKAKKRGQIEVPAPEPLNALAPKSKTWGKGATTRSRTKQKSSPQHSNGDATEPGTNYEPPPAPLPMPHQGRPGDRFGLQLEGAAPPTFVGTESIHQYQEMVEHMKAGSSNSTSWKYGLLVHGRRCSQLFTFAASDHSEIQQQQAKASGSGGHSHLHLGHPSTSSHAQPKHQRQCSRSVAVPALQLNQGDGQYLFPDLCFTTPQVFHFGGRGPPSQFTKSSRTPSAATTPPVIIQGTSGLGLDVTSTHRPHPRAHRRQRSHSVPALVPLEQHNDERHPTSPIQASHLRRCRSSSLAQASQHDRHPGLLVTQAHRQDSRSSVVPPYGRGNQHHHSVAPSENQASHRATSKYLCSGSDSPSMQGIRRTSTLLQVPRLEQDHWQDERDDRMTSNVDSRHIEDNGEYHGYSDGPPLRSGSRGRTVDYTYEDDNYYRNHATGDADDLDSDIGTWAELQSAV